MKNPAASGRGIKTKTHCKSVRRKRRGIDPRKIKLRPEKIWPDSKLFG